MGRRTGGVVGLAGAAAVALAVTRARGRTRRIERATRRMDPERQAREVLWLSSSRDLGWDSELALSFALFRTYAVPSISVVLDATGEFTDRSRKRYDDTELVIAEMGKHGLESERGRTALRRMNAMHAAFDVDREDMLYVLTTFIMEPIRWAERFGWRPMHEVEQLANMHWHRRLGRHMGLGDLPTDLAWFDAFNRRFEAEHFRFHPANRRVADASMRLFLDVYLPRPLHGAGEVVVRALLDPPLLEALGYEPAPPGVVRAVETAMRTRALVQRRLLPERRRPWDLTTVARPTYPGGYRVAQLGTFPDRATRDRARAALEGLRA